MAFEEKKSSQVSPQIRSFIEQTINRNPAYAHLTGKEREKFIQQLAKELQDAQITMIKTNLTSSQLAIYDQKLGKNPQDGANYIQQTIPNFQNKIDQIFTNFIQKYSGKK